MVSEPVFETVGQMDRERATTAVTSFVDGTWIEPARKKPTMTLENPATRGPLATVHAASADQVDAAVQSARGAQRVWWALGPAERTRRLVRWANVVRDHADEVAELDVRTVGRLRHEAVDDVVKSCGQIEYWAYEGPQVVRRSERSAVPAHLFLTTPAPVGVAAILLPGNVPSRMFLVHSAVALGCGNAVVVKPADASPLSALRIAELAVEAGLPPGLINVVVGDGATGAALAAHDDIGGLSFTGSTATGRHVAGAVAERFGKASLELGGKAPQLIFPDADLDAVSEAIVWSFCSNAGQICTAGTRALVHVDVYDRLVEQLVLLTGRVRVGSPMDPTTHVGPVSSRRQFDKVIRLIEGGKRDARLVIGGEPVGDLPGYYVQPTIFADVPSTAEIFQEEVFGPVLCVTPFGDEREAIALANNSRYSLASNVWTADLRRAFRVAEQIEAGTVWLGTSRVGDPHMPLRAGRQSGNSHLRGLVDVFTQEKLVVAPLGPEDAGPHWGLAQERTA